MEFLRLKLPNDSELYTRFEQVDIINWLSPHNYIYPKKINGKAIYQTKNVDLVSMKEELGPPL